MNAQGVANTIWAYGNGVRQLSSGEAAALQLEIPRILPSCIQANINQIETGAEQLGWQLNPEVTAALAAKRRELDRPAVAVSYRGAMR